MSTISSQGTTESVPPDCPTRGVDVWQFSLRSLFGLTTAVAGGAALAAAKGIGTLPLYVGLVLAWLNGRGWLARCQTPKSRPKVFYGAWLLFSVSLFLPVTRGCHDERIYGWQTATFCATTQLEWIKKTIDSANQVQQNEPVSDSDSLWRKVYGLLYITMLNLANVMMLASPFYLRRLQRGLGQRGALPLALLVTAVWLVPIVFFPAGLDSAETTIGHGLLLGFYVWCLSFAVLQLPVRITLRTWFAMLTFAVTCIVVTAIQR